MTNGGPIKVLNGPSLASDFCPASAAGFSAATGTGDINDYVKIIDQPDAGHVLFSAAGNVRSAGMELMDLKFTRRLNVGAVYACHQITA